MSQAKYAHEIQKRYNMADYKFLIATIKTGMNLSVHEDFKPMNATLCRELVGSLIYPITTKPNSR
jgi:hypothetical protein